MKDTIKAMEFEFFAKGNHKIDFEKMMELKNEDKAFILDIRSEDENKYVNFPFAYNIPVNQVMDRLEEIPKDKTVVLFCSTATRAAMILPYLLNEGYDAKILPDTIGEFAGHFKPGYVFKQSEGGN